MVGLTLRKITDMALEPLSLARRTKSISALVGKARLFGEPRPRGRNQFAHLSENDLPGIFVLSSIYFKEAFSPFSVLVEAQRCTNWNYRNYGKLTKKVLFGSQVNLR